MNMYLKIVLLTCLHRGGDVPRCVGTHFEVVVLINFVDTKEFLRERGNNRRDFSNSFVAAFLSFLSSFLPFLHLFDLLFTFQRVTIYV